MTSRTGFQLRVPGRLAERVEAAAGEAGLTRTEFARMALDAACTRSEGEALRRSRLAAKRPTHQPAERGKYQNMTSEELDAEIERRLPRDP